MSYQLLEHVTRLSEKVEQLRSGTSRVPCQHCQGTGLEPPRTWLRRPRWWSWKRLVYWLNRVYSRIAVTHCRQCHGTGRQPIARGSALAEEMAADLDVIRWELERLAQADAALRGAGIRVEQPPTARRPATDGRYR